MLAGTILANCACLSHTRYEPEQSDRSYRAVRFASSVSLVVIPHAGEPDATQVLNGVLEVGGAVDSVRGDTLVMRPYLISMLEDGRVVTLNSQSNVTRGKFPDLALVPVRLAIHEENRSSWKPVAGLVVPWVIGVLLAWYALRHNAW